MKKAVSFLLCVMILCSLSINFFTAGAVESTTEETICFEDGSYMVVSLVEENTGASTYTTYEKSGTKTYKFYDSNDNHLWTAKVTGVFRYTGSTSTCMSSSVSHTIIDSQWKMTSGVASKNANKAIGDFTFKRYFAGVATTTKMTTITLTCSVSGTLS